MASGAKKKAARRKKEKKASPTNPNPNSDPLPPLQHQGEVEESFETPRWHPDGSGNLSSPEILRSDLKPAEEGSGERYDSPNLEAFVNDDVFHVMEEEDHVLDGEGSYVFVENPDDHLVGSEVKEKDTIQSHGVFGDASVSLGKEVKIVPWLDEEMHSVDFEAIANGFDVGLKDLVFEKLPVEKSVTETDEGRRYGLPKIEESLEETNSDELANNPEVLVPKLVDASLSLGKGGKIVPWPYEGISSVELEAIANGIDVDLKDLVLEKSPRENYVTELDEDEGNVLPEREESSEGTKLDELAEQNSTLIGQSMFIAEDVSGGSKVTMEKCMSVENTLDIKGLSQSSKTTAVNLDKNSFDTSPEGREEKVLPLPAEVNGSAARIEFVPRNEVARGPLVERRATLWNCCGWLDVLIGSGR